MVILKDFPCNSALLLHCLAWCHAMTPVLLVAYGLWMLIDRWSGMKRPQLKADEDAKNHSTSSHNLTGGFKYLLCSPLLGEIIQFDEHIFSEGLKPPTSNAMRSIIQTSWVVSVLLAVLVRASRLSFCRIAACSCECLLWGGVFFFNCVSWTFIAMSLPKPLPTSS